MNKQLIVFSLGGSLIVPKKVNYTYLKNFKKFIIKIKDKYNIVIVTGGGKIARDYIKALHNEDNELKSLVGIMATKLNAQLVSSLLGLNENIPDSLKEVKNEVKKEGIAVCGALGFQPNMTSDGDAVQIANYLKAKLFVNLTNVDGLFDKDPKKFKDAKLIRKITYDGFLKFFNFEFHPGQNFVLDHFAAQIIKKYKIKTVIANGKNFNNLNNILSNKKFTGTLIS